MNHNQMSGRMEETQVYTILSTLILIVVIILLQKRSRNRNLPPSPQALPIIGHLHLLKQPIHQTFQKLSQKYGPIISLQLATRRAIVVSSPSAVEECFSRNDIIFANRARFLIGKYVNYNNTTLGVANYGEHWRNLRRISSVELLSVNRLNHFTSIRKEEVNFLLGKLHRASCHGYVEVMLRSMLLDLTTNIIMRMVAGKQYYGTEDLVKGTTEEGKLQFREIMEEFFRNSEVTNLGDLFPMLEWFDFDGFKNKVVKLGEKFDSFLQGLLDEHRVDKFDRDTMISHLLALQESHPDSYSDEIIKGLILVFLTAGTETSSTAIEWAMANLLNNPNVLKKAKAELDAKVGEDRLIEESDLSKLNYLQSIIFENLRLCPVAPLLLPHFSSDNCTVGGFDVAANTMLFVNAWSIQRDPNLWKDPLSFKPERFENGKPQGVNFFPFGLGRRACPGEGLANKEMGLTLGALIQCFDWERVDDKEIDMSAKTTIVMSKLEPLIVKCKSRPILHKLEGSPLT